MTTDDTRARLLRAGAVHFARQGYDGASLRRIADDVGIRAASIFHHFPGGKAALHEAILGEIGDSIRIQIVERYGVDAGLAPVDSIVRMAGAFWDYFEAHPDFATLILHFSSGMDRELAGGLEDAARGIVATSHAAIVEAQERGELGDFDVPHFMIWAAAHTLTVHGAPNLASFVVPSDPEKRLRASYLAMVRGFIAP